MNNIMTLSPKKLLSTIGFVWLMSLFPGSSCPNAGAVETFFEQDQSLPLVYLNVAVMTGSASDPAGRAGMMNFLGEMLLRGTDTKSKEQIDLALDQMGARLEVETRAESLVIRGAVLTEQLDPFLALIEELLSRSVFPENEIRKLKAEITSAILEEEAQDGALAIRKATEFLFNGHPYGNPALGKTAAIRALSREELVREYDRWIRAPHLLVVGTGKAESARIREWSRHLETLRPETPATAKREVLPAPVVSPHRRLLLVDKPDRSQTQILVGQIGLKMSDPAYYPLVVANYAFGGPTFSSTLMQEIRVKRGWSYGASSNFRFGTRPRSWFIHIFPASKDTPAALSTTLGLIGSLGKIGISASDFDQATRSIINGAGFNFDTPRKRVENRLIEVTLGLPEGFIEQLGPAVSHVRLSDVNSALATFIRPDSLSITVLGTFSGPGPAQSFRSEVEKAAAVKPADTEVVPYTRE